MGTEGPPVETRLSPNPADAESPHLLVESVTPLQAPETVLGPPVHQAELFAQALLDGLEPPTRSQVFDLINLLDFKDGSRKDIAEGSSFLLGGYRHGGDYGVMSNTRCFPYTTKVLIAYLLSVQPSHLFCSIAVHSNLRTAMHRDFNNADYPNLICPISEFTGGAIWCESPHGSVTRVHQDRCLQGELHEVSQGPVLLPVKSSFHCTEPWSGNRQVLVAYAGTDVARLSNADYQFLLDLGFPVAGMRGTDVPPSLLHCPSTPCLPMFLQKVGARIRQRPLHELICLEVFCGDASLTAEIRKHGLPRSFGVDHRVASARASVVVLDLSSPSAQAIFLETLRQPNVACCLLSPPCGTTAAARGCHSGPTVLRTSAEPLGVTGLSGCDLKRVALANCLFSFVAAVLLECHELGVLFSLEHPFRSMLWQIPEIKDALRRLPHAVSDFHHCMFGSQRRKHTKLVHCVPRFSRLQLHCTQDHVHLHQTRLPDGSFASGAEARRPPLLCKLVALSVSEQLVELGALPSPRDLSSQMLSPTLAARAAFNTQPRGKVLKPLVSEFAQVVTLRGPSALLPSGSKLAAAFPVPPQVQAFPHVSGLPAGSKCIRAFPLGVAMGPAASCRVLPTCTSASAPASTKVVPADVPPVSVLSPSPKVPPTCVSASTKVTPGDASFVPACALLRLQRSFHLLPPLLPFALLRLQRFFHLLPLHPQQHLPRSCRFSLRYAVHLLGPMPQPPYLWVLWLVLSLRVWVTLVPFLTPLGLLPVKKEPLVFPGLLSSLYNRRAEPGTHGIYFSVFLLNLKNPLTSN